MIRLYSDPMTALEVKRGFARGTIPLTIVTSETDTRESVKTVQVHFYGELANSVASEVVQGSKFLFRGFIDVGDDGNPIIVGLTLTTLATRKA